MPERMVYNQTDCWKGLQNGDPVALGYLYDTYAGILFEKAAVMTDNRDLVKDTLQDVFINIWFYRKSLGNVLHSQHYLVKVMRHLLLKKLNTPSSLPTEKMILVCPDLNAEEKMISSDLSLETGSRLRHAVTHLTEKQQSVIQLRFYDGLSYKQIAVKLRMNYQSVNNLVFRTLLHLRRQL